MEAGTQYRIPKPGGDGKKKKKMLTAMCQASETSEWKGSVGKEVAGVDDQKPGKRARKAQQREKATRLFGARFLAQQSVAHADSGEATQRPSY